MNITNNEHNTYDKVKTYNSVAHNEYLRIVYITITQQHFNAVGPSRRPNKNYYTLEPIT